MSEKVDIEINLQTRIKVDKPVDEKWLREVVYELEVEAEEKFDMGFSSNWKVRETKEGRETNFKSI